MSVDMRRAVVTGANADIVEAVADRLAHEGYAVSIWGYAPGTDWNKCFENEPLGVDVIVNCGAEETIGAVEGLAEADWDAALKPNLEEAFFLTQAAARYVNAGGAIVNVCSIRARIASGRHVAYAAASAGVGALTKAFAARTLARGVRCNSIAAYGMSGPVDEHTPPIAKTVLPGREMLPLELAEAVAFLVSPAANAITGYELPLCGGMHMFRDKPETSAYAEESGGR